MADIEKTYGTLVTDIGTSLITEAVMEGEKINITHIAVGDGGGAYYQPTPSMTQLKNENWRSTINSVFVNEESPNMIDVIAVIPSDVGGWTIREMALFDENGNMIAICNTPDTEKVIITSGAAGEVEVTMHIEISNTGAISFVIDPTVIIATKRDIERHNASLKAHEGLFQSQSKAVSELAQQINTNFSNIQTEFNNKQTQINTLQSDVLTFKNISLTTSSFTSNTDTDYPYKAQITCTGVTADHVPFVVFDKDSAATGIFAPYAETIAGKVIIYAVKPAACTIESIVCTRG